MCLLWQHPGVATVSTSVAAPGQMPQMAAGPIAAPVVAPSPASVAAATPPPQPPTVTTQVSEHNLFLRETGEL